MARLKLRHLPLRVSAGAFILNAGLGKLSVDKETAGQLHGMAKGTYPALSDMDPEQFAKLLGGAEVTLGATLLAPVVSSRLAGLGLTAFATGLLGMYLKTPGLRQEGSLRPTQQGTAIAKDLWLLGIGLSLLID